MFFFWYRIVGAFFRLLPIKKNKIVFSCFFGKGYSDNPKCLAEELKKRNGYELVWLVKGKNNAGFPNDLRIVKRWTLKELYDLATAQIWIDNSRKHYGVVKRKGQYYVQTWHANVGLKKAEADAIDKLSVSYVKSAKNDSKMADIVLSGSSWCTKNIKSSFWYNGKILEYGIPRSDVFYKAPEEFVEKVYTFYKLEPETRLILYAPTFRVNNSLECYSIDYKKLLQGVKEKWGARWKVLVRLHPNIQNMQNELLYDEDILNGSLYADINELIIASELLITDYSSCMFDAMEASKKVVLFATDIDDYMEDRGLHFSFEELPFLLAKKEDELHDRIRTFDEKVFKNKVDFFMEQHGFCNCENSSERIVNYILEKVNSKL